MTEQGSPEWKALRLGKVTASRVADVVAKTKTGWGASRANYAAALVVERLTGTPQDTYTNGAMQWGCDTEPQAKLAYEFHQDIDIEAIDFVPHPTIEMSGASPDGLVGEHGLVEFKCPTSAKHIETLLGGEPEDRYVKQMQWQMACTGRDWCDFVSFDPRLPAEMQMFVKRIERDDKMIKELEAEVGKFLFEVDATVAQLRANYQAAEAA